MLRVLSVSNWDDLCKQFARTLTKTFGLKVFKLKSVDWNFLDQKVPTELINTMERRLNSLQSTFLVQYWNEEKVWKAFYAANQTWHKLRYNPEGSEEIEHR